MKLVKERWRKMSGRYKHVNKADGSGCLRYQSAIDIRGRSVHGSASHGIEPKQLSFISSSLSLCTQSVYNVYVPRGLNSSLAIVGEYEAE